MTDILKLNLAEMAGLSFDCSCGRRHSVDIRKIIIGRGVTGEIVNVVRDFGGGRIFLLADNNTYKVCGSRVENLLKDGGFNIKTFIFDTVHPLVPDEKTVGRLFIELDKEISLIVAVGSGTLNDLARIASDRMGIPYIIVGTAPSMDGYASVVSPLIVGSYKHTYNGVYPFAIIGDTDIMKDAPMHMLQAGFGDILGKITALCDWELSRRINGEYYCETIASLVKTALNKCIESIDGIKSRDRDAVGYVMEALVLSGITIGLAGDSRPASGAEHMIAHYWESMAIARGEEHPLHGNLVGGGTVVTSLIYDFMRDRVFKDLPFPDTGSIEGLLNKLGAAAGPVELGVGRELFKESIIRAKDTRNRYTILNVAFEQGVLGELADMLTDRFYK